MPSPQNIFLYWIGKEYALISVLRNLIYMHHQQSPDRYQIHFLTPENLHQYFDAPASFFNLLPAHQADIIRVHCLCEYGGIWLDSDTLVLEPLDPLFQYLRTHDGFFIFEGQNYLCNGVFGSRAKTPLMLEWNRRIQGKLATSKVKARYQWTSFGSDILNSFLGTNLIQNYYLLDGRMTIYPVNWDHCVDIYLKTPMSRGKDLEREFQPLIVLVNSVYKEVEGNHVSENEDSCRRARLYGDHCLHYFLNKSFDRIALNKLDFIEIGAGKESVLDCDLKDVGDGRGILIEPVLHYFNQLPDLPHVKTMLVAVSSFDGDEKDNFIAHVPQAVIQQRKLPEWALGCNSLNRLHPMHVRLRTRRDVIKQPIQVISCKTLFRTHAIHEVQLLKITTEGDECKILEDLYEHVRFLPRSFFPRRILFSSTHLSKEQLDSIETMFSNRLEYSWENRGGNGDLIQLDRSDRHGSGDACSTNAHGFK